MWYDTASSLLTRNQCKRSLHSLVPSSKASLIFTAPFLCLWIINVFWRRPQSLSSACLTLCRLTHSCVVRRWSQFEPHGQQASRQTVSPPQRLPQLRDRQVLEARGLFQKLMFECGIQSDWTLTGLWHDNESQLATNSFMLLTAVSAYPPKHLNITVKYY